MTVPEARTIAAFFLHFRCPIRKIGDLAATIWGPGRANELAGAEREEGFELGASLVIKMEEVLELEEGESMEMDMEEQKCLSCGFTNWYISHSADTAKECASCGEMASFRR